MLISKLREEILHRIIEARAKDITVEYCKNRLRREDRKGLKTPKFTLLTKK